MFSLKQHACVCASECGLLILWNRLRPAYHNTFLSSNLSTSLARVKTCCFVGANRIEKRFCKGLCGEKWCINVRIQYNTIGQAAESSVESLMLVIV